MKIVIATGIYPPDIGGPATYAENLKQQLEECGWTVEVVSYGRGEEDIRWVSRSLPRLVRYTVYFWQVLQASRGADAIYTLDPTAAGLPAALAAFISRKKLLIRIGGDLLWERAAASGVFVGDAVSFYRSGAYKGYKTALFKVIRWVLHQADTIVAHAPLLKDIYTNYYNVAEENIVVHSNAVTTKNRIQKAAPQDEKTIIFAGRLVPYKNVDVLIDAFKTAYKDIAPARLIIYGEGPERKKLEHKIQHTHTEKVELRGYIPHKKLIEKIQRSDLGVSLSWTDFNPNFILDYVSLGIPAIISRHNGLAVNLPDEFQVDSFDKDKVAAAMVHMLNNYEHAFKSFRSVDIHRTWEDVTQEIITLIHNS